VETRKAPDKINPLPLTVPHCEPSRPLLNTKGRQDIAAGGCL
jgi:hypothetical protein